MTTDPEDDRGPAIRIYRVPTAPARGPGSPVPHGREKGTERPLICHHHLQRNVTPLELRGVLWGQPLLQELHGDGLLETRDR